VSNSIDRGGEMANSNAKELRTALATIADYLDLKAEQYALEYPTNHAIRLTCDRMRMTARIALKEPLPVVETAGMFSCVEQ
jgi:hypothetical protein